jgi:leucyl aminopeptidase
MKISVKKESVASIKDEALITFMYEDKVNEPGDFEKIDKRCNGKLFSYLKNKNVKGKLGEVHQIYLDDANIKRIIVVGVGKKKDLTLEILRRSVSVAARYLRDSEITSFSVDVAQIELDEEKIGQAITEAVKLSLHNFEKYKTEKKKIVEKVCIIVNRNENRYNLGMKNGEVISDYTIIARDLVNEPGSVLTAREFANRTKEICGKTKVKLTVFDKARIKKEKMEALLGVNQGSKDEPVFMIMEYMKGKGDPIVLVGKGITFDTGGVQIKPGAYMNGMQADMAGGAAVVGIVNAAAALKLKLNIVGLVPATSNMPDGSSYLPGDILRAANGKTIEIGHTDAEGRLALADALSYSRKFKPKEIIDFATLTGACVVALGSEAAGMWSNNEKMPKDLAKAGEETGDRVWHMPLYDDYAEYIKSDVADVKNVGHPKGNAGACTAAMFLKNFVPEKVDWVHLDIAGTADIDAPKPYAVPLGTGAGVRVVVEYLRKK